MMTDPKRILDDSATNDVDTLSRDLLTSLSPTKDEQERLFGRVLSHVGMAAAAGTAAATVSTQAGASGTAKVAFAVKSSLGKWLLPLLAAVPVGAGVGYVALSNTSEPPPPPAVRTSPVVSKPVTTETPPPLLTDETTLILPKLDPAPSPPAEQAAPRVEPSAAPSKESALREEDRLVRKARDQWKAGQREAALATLSELSRKSPGGVLLREREMRGASIQSSPSLEYSPALPRDSSK